MWKSVILAAFAGALAGVMVQPTPADASRAQCRQVAKAKFPADAKMRRDFKRYCIREWKAYRTAHRGAV
jgi:hypothetical protein